MSSHLVLILGLLVFLGTHSIRVLANGARSAMIARLGMWGWKAVFAVISLIGFVLIVKGYGIARAAPLILWSPPIWTRHLAALLTLLSFILLVASVVPGNRIKSLVGHPQLAGVKIWALVHLLANGTLADVLLFGGFLVWAVLLFASSRRRDRLEHRSYPSGPVSRTVITVVIGVLAWGIFAMKLHELLIGIRPFG